MRQDSRNLYRGRVVTLNLETHQLPDGRQGQFEVIRHSGAAAALPILPDGRWVLVRQYRPAADGMVWEIQAGRLEPGEAPADCIVRELAEEIGYHPGRVEPLGLMHPALGYSDERLHLFVARELEPVPQALEEHEFLEVVPLPPTEALHLLAAGEVTDSKTQVALLLAAQRGLDRNE